MPHVFLKPTVIARTALGLLQREIVLPRTVWGYGIRDFRGAKDDTITLRLPAILSARDYEFRTRNNPIQVDDLVEKGVDVKLDRHPYSAVAVTDEQLSLDIVSFAEQVLAPQVRAVAERLEDYIATALSTAPYKSTVAYDASAGSTDSAFKAAVRARRILNEHNVPMSDRFLVVGTGVEEAFLNDEHLNKFDQSGSDSALRDASIGRIAGFTVTVANGIAPEAAYAYHRTAIAFGNVAPVVPDGAPMGRSETFSSLAMRWLRDYDPNFLRDRSVVSSFAGATPVTDGNESQTINLGSATAGSITITFDGQTTGSISYDATAATVQAALEALSNVEPGDITVTGGPLPGTITLEFAGRYQSVDVDEVTVTPSGLTGGTVTVASIGRRLVRGVKFDVTGVGAV